MLKRATLFIILTALASLLSAQAAPLPPPRTPSIDAERFILMDYSSGQVIAEQGADERADPASITKLMTAYVVFDALREGLMTEDELVIISHKAWKAIGSRMFVEVGKQVSVIDLLRGMIIQSGNDAAIALAEHTAGSVESFADRMNQYAARLGLNDTHYMNPTGLTDPEHYTTARDIATLAASLIADFPDHYALYKEKSFTFNGISQRNRNRLLWRDDSVDGVKTGHTEAAGYCLASSAKRDDMRLVSVVLGSSSGNARISASESLLNWGFRFFESVEVSLAGDPIASTRIYKGDRETLSMGRLNSTWVVIPRGQKENIELITEVDGKLKAPVQRGQEIGELIVRHQGRDLARMPLQSLDDIPLGSFLQRLRDEAILMIGG